MLAQSNHQYLKWLRCLAETSGCYNSTQLECDRRFYGFKHIDWCSDYLIFRPFISDNPYIFSTTKILTKFYSFI